MIIMDFVIQASQVYETCSTADALKTGERNPIQRAFDYYFSAFLQSSNSLKHYEEPRKLIWSLKGV